MSHVAQVGHRLRGRGEPRKVLSAARPLQHVLRAAMGSRAERANVQRLRKHLLAEHVLRAVLRREIHLHSISRLRDTKSALQALLALGSNQDTRKAEQALPARNMSADASTKYHLLGETTTGCNMQTARGVARAKIRQLKGHPRKLHLKKKCLPAGLL